MTQYRIGELVSRRLARPLLDFSLGCALLMAGCGGSPVSQERFDVAFFASDERRQPLPGVSIKVAGQAAGVTGPDGTLSGSFEGRVGEERAVEITCPKGYRPPESTPPLRLQQLLELDESAAGMRYPARCTRETRTFAVVVRTEGRQHVPVLVNGSVSGQTDAEGLLHLVYELEPSATLRVKLDTSGSPALRPQDPLRVFTVPEQDSVVVFDQKFQEHKPKKPRRVARPAPEAPQRHVPYRLN